MVDLSALSAAKLNALIAKRESTHSAILNETIAAGYGQVRHNDIVRLARDEKTPLLVDYVAASDSLNEARQELSYRMRYHGSDKPIRRPASA